MDMMAAKTKEAAEAAEAAEDASDVADAVQWQASRPNSSTALQNFAPVVHCSRCKPFQLTRPCLPRYSRHAQGSPQSRGLQFYTPLGIIYQRPALRSTFFQVAL